MSSACRFQQSVRRTEVWLRSDTNLVGYLHICCSCFCCHNLFKTPLLSCGCDMFVFVFVFVVIIFSKYPHCHVDATCTFIPKEKGKFCVCNDGFNGNSTKKLILSFIIPNYVSCIFVFGAKTNKQTKL